MVYWEQATAWQARFQACVLRPRQPNSVGMPEAAQFEPDDKRLRPITAADSTLWSLATFVIRYRLPLGVANRLGPIVSSRLY